MRETGLLQDSEESTPLQIFAMERDGNDSRPVRVPVEAVGSGGVIKEEPCRPRARITISGVQAGRRVMREKGLRGRVR